MTLEYQLYYTIIKVLIKCAAGQQVTFPSTKVQQWTLTGYFTVLLETDHEGVPGHGHDEARDREQQEVERGTLQVHGSQREGRQDLEEGRQGSYLTFPTIDGRCLPYFCHQNGLS